jgi:hypothetical protein
MPFHSLLDAHAMAIVFSIGGADIGSLCIRTMGKDSKEWGLRG